MGKQQPSEIIYPPNALKAKVGRSVNNIDEDAIRRAEEALAGMKDEMQGWLEDELERLQTVHKDYVTQGAGEETHQALYTSAHDLKGLGATYEYPLVARIAGSLCELMEGIGEGNPIPKALLDGHIHAICGIVSEKIQSEDDPMGMALVGEVEAKVQAFLAA